MDSRSCRSPCPHKPPGTKSPFASCVPGSPPARSWSRRHRTSWKAPCSRGQCAISLKIGVLSNSFSTPIVHQAHQKIHAWCQIPVEKPKSSPVRLLLHSVPPKLQVWFKPLVQPNHFKGLLKPPPYGEGGQRCVVRIDLAQLCFSEDIQCCLLTA